MSHSCAAKSSCHGSASARPWYRTPLVLTSLCLFALILISCTFPFLADFRRALFNYLKMMSWAILLGLFLGGLVDYYLPPEYISKHLAKSSRKTVFYAVALGFLMSACSHGILALSMELHKKGASGPAVMSFLLASPWTSLPVTVLLIGFFGWKALVLIAAALLIAIISGLIFQALAARGLIEKNVNTVATEENFSVREDIRRRFKAYSLTGEQIKKDFLGIARGMLNLSQMILWWVLIGIVMASAASAFIPSHIFMQYFGPSLLGLMLTLIAATLLEVCSEGTSPLAFEIYRQTGAFGNAFTFLMGGVITDFTEIGLVWANLGKKTAIWMVLVTLPQVILFGWLFNLFF